jgi:hypothetical protein
MTKPDIVARLRAHHAYFKSDELHSDIADDLRRAADEIERLRSAVARGRAQPPMEGIAMSEKQSDIILELRTLSRLIETKAQV